MVTGNRWKVKRFISSSFSGKLGSLTFRKCEFLQVLLEDGSVTFQQLVLNYFLMLSYKEPGFLVLFPHTCITIAVLDVL